MSLTPPERSEDPHEDGLVNAIERLARYATYLRQQGRRLHSRQVITIGHTIRNIIEEELGMPEYSRDMAYNYAEGTARAWDKKMAQEDADTARDEEANPNVYRPEDGHEFSEVTTPGSFLEGKCSKCGSREHLHAPADIEEKP